MKLNGYDRGSVLDMVLLLCGNIESALYVCNRLKISITDTLKVGKEYSVENIPKKDKIISDKMEVESIMPATEVSAEEMGMCPYGGIGFMAVGVDFEIK